MNIKNENKYNLSDIQMAEFVSRGYLIFNSVIDNKTNKLLEYQWVRATFF